MTARLLPLALLFGCGIPSAEDAEIAQAVGRHIERGCGEFADRETVDEERRGKTWYMRPGAGGHTTIVFYEVTTPEDMGRIETLAREALRRTEGARTVTLRFYERQKWRDLGNGTYERGPEGMLRKVRYDRDD